MEQREHNCACIKSANPPQRMTECWLKRVLLVWGLLLSPTMYGQRVVDYKPFPLSPRMEDSQAVRWLRKPVSDSLLIDDFEGERYVWYSKGIGQIRTSSEHAFDGKRSMRYTTQMRDSLHLTDVGNRTAWGSFGGEQGGENSFGIRFEKPQDWSAYNRISVWVYIKPSRNKNHHFFLYIENEGTDYSYPLQPRHDHCVQNLVEGQWQQVVWEFDYLDRSRICEFRIFQTLVGYEPGGDNEVTFYFDRLQLQQVSPDHYDGWQPDAGTFAFSHIGYRSADAKRVISTPKIGFESFTLTDEKGQEVFAGHPVSIQNSRGNFVLLDFSSFTRPGIYHVNYGGQSSEAFRIGDDVWILPTFAALNYYFCQRCGFAVPGYHDVCHQDWFGMKDDDRRQMNGGWHDAGDLSQGYFRTALGAYALLRQLKSAREAGLEQEYIRRVEDEALWGVKWIMKTRFPDGHHVSWARQRIWSDNQPGTIDDVVIRTSRVTWENFLGSAVLALASREATSISDNVRQSFVDAAKENWQWAWEDRPGWEYASDNEASWGAISSSILYQVTGDESYALAAHRFGQLLLSCQEQTYVDGIPLTGYFYTDSRRSRIVQNNHGAFYESPMVALRTLAETFGPTDKDWLAWYSAAVFYADCFLKPGSNVAAPFDLLPNAVYRRADMSTGRNTRTDRSNMEQYLAGTQLNENYAMRIFPVWSGDLFHGGTCCHLSTTWALAEASQLRHDAAGLTLAQEQLEWTLGRNPFGQSLMYGVGYNFATQFAYCSRDMVGGLPVGMDSFHDDAPYWHGSNYATSKETWIGTVNRFMGAVTAFQDGSKESTPLVKASLIPLSEKRYTARVEAAGQHTLSLLLLNGTSGFSQKGVTFRGTKKLDITITPSDAERPCMAMLAVDGIPVKGSEIVIGQQSKIEK